MTEQGREPGELERLVQDEISDARQRRAAEQAREAAARAAALASNAERDAAVVTLSEAYAHGRINAEELSERTTRALAARTHGELEQVLAGLRTRATGSDKSPARFIAAGAMTLLASPFLLIGLIALLAGDGLGEWIFGLVFLGVSVPGVLLVWRWAWPSR